MTEKITVQDLVDGIVANPIFPILFDAEDEAFKELAKRITKQSSTVEVEIAPGFLEEAANQMAARAQLRDKPQGERSMASIVKAFNALSGRDLTEAEGWEFMILLKMVRGRQGYYNRDDYVDGAAYFGLLGECESSIEDRRKSGQ